MTVFTYEKSNAKLIKVMKDGAFIGWLTQQSHRNTGLNTERYTYWTIQIDGVEISATTLTKAKQKIEGKADLKTGRPINV